MIRLVTSEKTIRSKSTFELSCNNILITKGSPVYLNVYHLSGINYALQIFGFGFFHSAIEIHNIEYSFGATEEDISGIFYNDANEKKDSLSLKEKIYLGNTIYSESEIKKILVLNIPFWLGKSYDPFVKNCNHFTKFFAKKFLRTNTLKNYPEYLNRITRYNYLLGGFYSPIKRIYHKISLIPSLNNQNNSSIHPDNQIEEKTSLYMSDKKEHKESKNFSSYSKEFSLNISNPNNLSNLSSPDRLVLTNEIFLKELEKYGTFFSQVVSSNLFFVPFSKKCEIKIESLFLNKLSYADKLLFIEHNFSDSFELYKGLLKRLGKEKNFDCVIEDFYKLRLRSKYIIEKISKINTLVKIKILHCILFILFKAKMISKIESIASSILSINKNDYLAIFCLAYVRFEQLKFPECSQILHNAVSECKDQEMKKNFIRFLEIIDELNL